MDTRTVDITKEKPALEELLSLARGGTEVILTEDDHPVARLVPLRPRIAGLNAGSISVADDFDASLPEELWSGGR